MKTKVDFLRRDLKALQADRREAINSGVCDRRGKDVAKMQQEIRKMHQLVPKQSKLDQWI